ncbi:hypothetical protein D9M68_808150 [compost metagenome]
MAATATVSVTSSGQACTAGGSPLRVCCATKRSSAAAPRADTCTTAPRAISASAVARPMPLDAPITQTRRPRQSVMGGLNGRNRGQPRRRTAERPAGAGLDSTKLLWVVMGSDR